MAFARIRAETAAPIAGGWRNNRLQRQASLLRPAAEPSVMGTLEAGSMDAAAGEPQSLAGDRTGTLARGDSVRLPSRQNFGGRAMKTVTGGSCAVLLALILMMDGHTLNAAASCESLSSLALPNTSITLAQMVPAGGFSLPGTGPAAVQQFSQLPAFCRVAATLTPSSDSDIKIEVWLPAAAWNGKFQAVGNGGWAGTISYGALASALQEGYATASTDTGHVGGTASFAIGHPEKVVDFAYRAVHEMAVKSKAVITAFYDPRHGSGPGRVAPQAGGRR